MLRFRLAAATAALLALGGCANQVANKEDLLLAAGFSFRPANTPQTAAALKKLPAHRFVREVRKGQPVWIYADPSICGCLYAGDDAAYHRYRQEVFQKQVADEQAQAALMNENAAMDQDATMMQWDMWGPWAPFYDGP